MRTRAEAIPAPLVAPDLLVATCGADGASHHANPAWGAIMGEDGLWGRMPVEDVRFANEYLADAARGSLVTHQVFLVAQPEHDLPTPVLLHFFPVALPGATPGKLPVVVAGEVLQEPASWAAAQTRRRRTEMLGQMAMGVAHDFNNLLTTILGHAELLRTTLTTESSLFAEDILGQLRAVERAASDGAALVRKIQQYIRHEKRERFEPVDLPTLAEEVLTLTRPYWHNEPRRQGLAIWVERTMEPVPPVLGSPTELREVLVNLILNAVQAMPAGGTLRLRTRVDPIRGGLAEVEDTGVGMTARVRARIFEPLFTTKGERGTGMGLTVANGIVQEHNGTIEVESEPGRGSLFRLVLPLARPEARPRPPVEVPPVTERRAVRILIVDDEPMVRQVTARLLRLKGHEVEEVEGGPEALAWLDGMPTDEPTFDLVITDLSMPDMNGRELAASVRQRWPALPVLLLTGDTDAEAHDGPGVDAVVKKPFKLDDLEAAVQHVLSAAGTEAAARP